jgi:hypothetical protein
MYRVCLEKVLFFYAERGLLIVTNNLVVWTTILSVNILQVISSRKLFMTILLIEQIWFPLLFIYFWMWPVCYTANEVQVCSFLSTVWRSVVSCMIWQLYHWERSANWVFSRRFGGLQSTYLGRDKTKTYLLTGDHTSVVHLIAGHFKWFCYHSL